MRRWADILRRLERFGADERGTALTEFIIVLPIFVIIFAGVGHLTRLNKTAIRLGATAYSDMWDKAVEVQTGDAGIHQVPGTAGQAVSANAHKYRGLQEEQGMQQIVRHETNNHGTGLLQNGTLGESFQRVRRARNSVELRHIDADLTNQISGVTGDSTYARSLFDDSGSAQTLFPGNAGNMGSLLDGHGIRPVLAAGARYGTVIGSKKGSVDVGGRTIKLKHYFTTLVAPSPRGEDAATAVARSAMFGVSAYDNLLGIATDQPLDQETIEVTHIEGAFPSQ